MSHFMEVCVCGKVLTQCRCPSRDKARRVSSKPCTHASNTADQHPAQTIVERDEEIARLKGERLSGYRLSPARRDEDSHSNCEKIEAAQAERAEAAESRLLELKERVREHIGKAAMYDATLDGLDEAGVPPTVITSDGMEHFISGYGRVKELQKRADTAESLLRQAAKVVEAANEYHQWVGENLWSDVVASSAGWRCSETLGRALDLTPEDRAALKGWAQ